MAERRLSRRALNRATLARQLLLDRAELPVAEAVRQVGGLQAQVVKPPVLGLWSRLRDFRREELVEAVARREVVRAAAMRATIHLVAAEDYLRLWAALAPALERGFKGFNGTRIRGLDLHPVVEAARRRLAEPCTFAELRPLLAGLEPDRDPISLAAAARAYLPLVQLPGGPWGYPATPEYVLVEAWLGRSPQPDADAPGLVRSYLRAFGPATVADLQAWAGRSGLKPVVQTLRPELTTFRDDEGRELLDVPGAPLPGEDASAPPRFLPEYDTALLGHSDRSRVIADEHRKAVFVGAGLVRATILVDGVVAGTWRIQRERKVACLVVEPFGRLPRAARAALEAEAERLVAFAEPAAAPAVRFA